MLGAGAALADDEVFKDRAAQESYAIGAQTARTLRKDGLALDVDMLIRGLRDGLNENGKLLLADHELKVVMSRVQQDVRRNMVIRRRDRAETARQQAPGFLLENGKQPGVQTQPSGLQYQVLTEGKGPKPFLNSVVEVRYHGTLMNGREFDASPADGSTDKWILSQSILGLKEAMQMMPVGSHWKVVIPANLGYGDRGRDQDLGPNEVLIYDIELVGIDQKKD
jgi:FKBP-type peptidyl-prolyl cis-trans isomerase FklB